MGTSIGSSAPAEAPADKLNIAFVGALAQRLGRDIEWDSARMEAAGCPKAAGFIRREYRKGWEIL